MNDLQLTFETCGLKQTRQPNPGGLTLYCADDRQRDRECDEQQQQVLQEGAPEGGPDNIQRRCHIYCLTDVIRLIGWASRN